MTAELTLTERHRIRMAALGQLNPTAQDRELLDWLAAQTLDALLDLLARLDDHRDDEDALTARDRQLIDWYETWDQSTRDALIDLYVSLSDPQPQRVEIAAEWKAEPGLLTSAHRGQLVQSLGLFDLTDRDRRLIEWLASWDQTTVDALADLLGRLSAPGRSVRR